MTQPNYYKHLNETDPLSIPIDMDTLAAKIVTMNYGLHRFLSAAIPHCRRKWQGYAEDWRKRNPTLPESECPYKGDDSIALALEDLFKKNIL